MLTAAMVLAVLAAALHVLIFYMESIAWEGPLARKTFGGTPEEARCTDREGWLRGCDLSL